MFNSDVITVNSYIPYYPKEKSCLHDTLLIEKYKKIQQNLPKYFTDVQLTNFDIIHHELRGDPLNHSVNYYQRIRRENFENISKQDEHNFISNAIRARRDDIYVEKDVMKKHFVDENVKEKLRKKGIFLSSMERRAAYKKRVNEKYRDSW